MHTNAANSIGYSAPQDEVSILNAFAGIVPSGKGGPGRSDHRLMPLGREDRVPISPRLKKVFDEWLEKLNTVVGTLQYSNIKPLHVAVLTAGDIRKPVL